MSRRSKRARTRDAALEDAALICERQARYWRKQLALLGSYRIESAIMESERCAQAIRALKGEEENRG